MIGEAIRAGLKRDGFVVDWVHDAEAAAQVLRTEPFELVLLAHTFANEIDIGTHLGMEDESHGRQAVRGD